MNPFFMQMINPMGMGGLPFMGGMNFMMPPMCCGSSFMSMPYYSDTNLWFFNQPVYRDTRYDYLLDPSLAFQQAKTNWQNGGSMFGFNMLPGLSFPGISQLSGMPGMPGFLQQPAKTEAEKEAEKKKAEEAKKPAAQKAQYLNTIFTKVKKLAEDKNNHFPEIPEELSKKAEEAMKKETAVEQLAAMKEVMSSIPAETLRKTVLADDNVRKQLRKAGYNFNIAGNKYSLKNADIKNNDIDHSDKSIQLHSDIVQKKYNELQLICGQLSDTNEAREKILGLISSWNDKYKGNERGILRLIASNLPTGNDAVAKSPAVKECVRTFANALLAKAGEYEGYEKIAKARDEVNKSLNAVLATKPKNGFDKANIDKLAEACDKLYARLRMQEAVTVRDYINKNFKYMNEVKENLINDGMIVEESQKDLEAEGLDYPKVNELDTAPFTEEIVLQQEEEMRNLDEEFDGDGKGMMEALVKEGKLTKVLGRNATYQTKAVKPSGKVRYFGVIDDKVYEVYKKDNKFVKIKDAKEATAAEIGAYDMTVERTNKLVDEKALVAVEVKGSRYPVFKATGADEYYIIKDNKLYHMLDVQSFNTKKEKVTDGTNEKERDVAYVNFKASDRKGVKLSEITSDDVEEFSDSDIRTKKQVDAEKKAEEDNANEKKYNAVVSKYTKDKIVFKTANAKPENFGLAKTGVNGYFKNIPPQGEPTVYFKYDDNPQSATCGKLVPLKGVTSITEDGIMVQNGVKKPCRELQTPQESAAELQEVISKSSKKSNSDLALIKRKFNSFKSYATAGEIIKFLEGYKSSASHLLGLYNDSDISIAVMNNQAISEADKKEYIKLIATRVLQVVDTKKIVFDKLDDKATLESIANGHLAMYNYSGNAITLGTTAAELDRIIEIVIDKYRN